MFDFISDFMSEFLNTVLNLLPYSPFQRFIESVRDLPYLGYLNWFMPISTFIAIGQAWLVSIGIFYTYMIVLRWLRAIE